MGLDMELDESLYYLWCFECRRLGPSCWKKPKSRFVLTVQKIKFSIKDFFIKGEKIHSFLEIFKFSADLITFTK